MRDAVGRNGAALVAGLLFGLGLAISQMVNPRKVLDFLDVAGNWDPSLLLVLGGAVGVTVIAFRLVLRRDRPLIDTQFYLPTAKDIDRKLLIGAGIFGIGWGLGGYCPGPAIAALSTASIDALVFVGGMVAGSLVYRATPSPS